MPLQHINLADPRFTPQAVRWSARQAAVAAVGMLALTALAGQGLQWRARGLVAQAQDAEAGVSQLRRGVAQVAAPAAAVGEAELARLKANDAALRRVRQALEAGVAGNRQGHADYLSALARQAPGNLWITGFSVSEDGSAIDLEGRMLDTAVFTDYLRRLNGEARFNGRPFAQLQLKALPASGDDGAPMVTEFVLRSTSPAPGQPP